MSFTFSNSQDFMTILCIVSLEGIEMNIGGLTLFLICSILGLFPLLLIPEPFFLPGELELLPGSFW